MANGDSEFYQYFKAVLGLGSLSVRLILELMIFSYLPILDKILPIKHRREYHSSIAHLRSIVGEIIDKRKEEIKNGRDNQIDLLSIMLKGGAFSDDLLVDQVLAFLAAGMHIMT